MWAFRSCVLTPSQNLTIDGDLSEWTEGEPLGMGRAEQAHGKNGKAWGGPGDISAYAYTRWDEQYFYFACAVTDDVFYQPYSLADMQKGDSVVFALATNGSLSARKSGEPAYAEFGMALLKDKQGILSPLSPASRRAERQSRPRPLP